MAGKKGQSWSKAMTKHQRDEIALTKIENYMDSQMDKVLACPDCGKQYENVKDITPAQSTLIRARYDKLRPTLASVEQTVINQDDKKTEAQSWEQMDALFAGKPEFLDELIRRYRSKPAEDLPQVH